MSANIKNKLKRLLAIFGLKITKDFKITPLLRRDVFQSAYQKKVLISYITEPFLKPDDFSHTNWRECRTAAELFHEFGYRIDVIDHFSDKRIDYSEYDIIYGMGTALEKSFSFQAKPLKRIFYATGCNPVYSNIRTLARVRDFYNSRGLTLLNSSRFLDRGFFLQTFLSDGVIVLGNDFVLDTYKHYDEPGGERFKNLPAFFYDVYDLDLARKDLAQARQHFLWFGSAGLLHKGLDLLLDIFAERPDLYLHICGAPEKEKDFFAHYHPLLTKSPNIISHGFVSLKSDEFKDLMNKCAFTISPSVSEGGSPAVLNTIASGGLIPLVTRSSGLDVNDFGIIIERPELASVKASINKALSLSASQLSAMSSAAKDNIRANYTYDEYRANLKNLLKNIIFK